MSYVDVQQRSRTRSILAVAAVHGLIANAVVHGLSLTVLRQPDTPTIATIIPDDPPPPPVRQKPLPERAATSDPRPFADPVVVQRPDFGTRTIEVPIYDGQPIAESQRSEPMPTPPRRA